MFVALQGRRVVDIFTTEYVPGCGYLWFWRRSTSRCECCPSLVVAEPVLAQVLSWMPCVMGKCA